MAIAVVSAEVRVLRAHVDESILADEDKSRIDPEKWRPLIMSFRQFFGLGQRLHSSRLGHAPESRYAPPTAQLKRALGKRLGLP